jgi:hypothetical protein
VFLFTCPEEFQHIIELAVDVSADGDGAPHWLDIGLFQEDFLGFLAQVTKVFLMQTFCLQ